MSSLLSAINASASALDAQRARMEVAVSNMANADSTRGPNNEPYRRREVTLEPIPSGGFASALRGAGADGVRVSAVVEDQTPFQRVYQPGHPDADDEGYIALPNIEVSQEMVDMLGAARAYQANLQAIGLIRDTIQKALELAR